MDHQCEEPTIFGRAVNDIYITMSSMTDELVEQCQPSSSDTLRTTVSNMVLDAAQAAIEKFKSRRTDG